MGRPKGMKLSEAHKKRISEAKKGVPNLELKGMHKSEAHKKALSESQIGKRLSESHKRNIIQGMAEHHAGDKISEMRKEMWDNPDSIYNKKAYRRKLAKIMIGNKRAEK